MGTAWHAVHMHKEPRALTTHWRFKRIVLVGLRAWNLTNELLRFGFSIIDVLNPLISPEWHRLCSHTSNLEQHQWDLCSAVKGILLSMQVLTNQIWSTNYLESLALPKRQFQHKSSQLSVTPNSRVTYCRGQIDRLYCPWCPEHCHHLLLVLVHFKNWLEHVIQVLASLKAHVAQTAEKDDG